MVKVLEFINSARGVVYTPLFFYISVTCVESVECVATLDFTGFLIFNFYTFYGVTEVTLILLYSNV